MSWPICYPEKLPVGDISHEKQPKAPPVPYRGYTYQNAAERLSEGSGAMEGDFMRGWLWWGTGMGYVCCFAVVGLG